MRLLFLCKRLPQQRDLIERPYGRFYHLPTALAELGHDVSVSLCSYRHLGSIKLQRNAVQWSSHDLFTLGLAKLWHMLCAQADAFRPDVIFGCSDTWAGWLAYRLSRRTGARLVIDAYDNYEAYMPLNLPLHWLWRRAVRAADLITVAGPQLGRKLAMPHHLGRFDRRIHVLPMVADPTFVPMDRNTCRVKLGLPLDTPLFGYSGGWTKSRSSDLILKAFALVRQQLPDARLVLTGKPPAHAASAPGVISLGYLDDALMPCVTNAVDVCCVVLANTSFGRFSYPAKLCEAMACNVPVVASATDAVAWMLGNDTRYLVRVGDVEDYARLMLINRAISDAKYLLPPSWKDSAKELSNLLTNLSH